MGKSERYAYLKEIRSHYLRVGRKAKGRILDEFRAVCGYHRKYAIRLLNRPVKRPRRRIGRRPVAWVEGTADGAEANLVRQRSSDWIHAMTRIVTSAAKDYRERNPKEPRWKPFRPRVIIPRDGRSP